jgi:uncharacterized protein YciI
VNDKGFEGACMKQYLVVLRLVPRLHATSNWTPEDHQAVADHFVRLEAAVQAGTVVLAGRTEEPLADTFGLVVFEAVDEEAAQRFMNDDPTVARGVMTARLHAYSIALLGRRSQ